jgi:hypothetical protein
MKKTIKIKSTFLAGAMTLVLIPQIADAEGNLYRYKNSKGILVIEDRIPPAYVTSGYDVLTRQGRVMMTVAAKSAAEDDVDKVELAQQRTEDLFLLRSFSHVEQIESARIRKATVLDREVSVIEKSLQDIRRNKTSIEKQAANRQRSGQKIPEYVFQELDELEEQELEYQNILILKQREVGAINARYRAYVERFTVLRSNSGQ